MPVTQLEITVQPSDTEQGATIVPAVQVELQDESGELVADATLPVTITIDANPAGGVLSGTLTKNAVAGVAVFNDLRINEPGEGYTLRATAQLGFHPAGLGSLWVTGDAPTLAGLSDGDKVGGIGGAPAWIDRITNVRQFTSGAEWAEPILRDGGPNGLRYLEFRGTNQMSFSNNAASILSIAGYAIFIVARIQQPGNPSCDWSGSVLYDFAGSNGYGDISLCLSGGQNKFRLNHYAGSGVMVSVTSAMTYVEDEWYIIAAWFDGSHIRLSVNGEVPVSAVSSNLAADAFTPTINFIHSLDVDIEEILQFKGFPGEDVIDNCWEFLTERTAISLV